MAKQGKSTLEIGTALGITGTEKEIRSYVSIKASNLRVALKTRAEEAAKEGELDADATKALVDAAVAKVPTLRRGRAVDANLDSILSDIIAKADAPPEEGEPEEGEEETTEAPE